MFTIAAERIWAFEYLYDQTTRNIIVKNLANKLRYFLTFITFVQTFN